MSGNDEQRLLPAQDQRPLSLHWILLSTAVDALIMDTRLRGCCSSGGIKTIGELFALGEAGRLRLKNYGRKSENMFQAAIRDFLMSPERVTRCNEAGPLVDKATRICADLYLHNQALLPAALDLSVRWQALSNPVVVWLQCANLFHLLQLCRADLIGGPSYSDGAAIEDKAALHRVIAPERHQQAEVALYLIARTILPIREWGPKLWLKYVPSWIPSSPIAEFENHAAIQTACEKQGIRTYGAYLSHERYHVMGIGPSFERAIFSGIDRACLKEPKTEAEVVAALRMRPFVTCLNDALHSLKKKQRDFEIVMDLLGAEGREPHSMAMIMEKFQISRERVRQIETKAWWKILRGAWVDFFVIWIVDLLKKNDGLIQLRSLEMLEPWFEGVTDSSDLFNRVLHKIPWPEGWTCSVQLLANGPALVALSGKDFVAFTRAVKQEDKWRNSTATRSAEIHKRVAAKVPRLNISPDLVRKYVAMTSEFDITLNREN